MLVSFFTVAVSISKVFAIPKNSDLGELILPSFVLATVPLAVIARMTRSSLLEVIKEDYMRTAQAKVAFHKTVELAEIDYFDESVTYDADAVTVADLPDCGELF